MMIVMLRGGSRCERVRYDDAVWWGATRRRARLAERARTGKPSAFHACVSALVCDIVTRSGERVPMV